MDQVATLLPAQLYRDNSKTTTTNSIELPGKIDDLIDNKMYRNKFRKLIREGFIAELMDLATIAHTKDAPSRWFAKVTAKSRWQGTLEWLKKVRAVAQSAADIAKRLLAKPDQMKAIYKACWRSKNALRHAVTAEETGRDKLKYFHWLCAKSKE